MKCPAVGLLCLLMVAPARAGVVMEQKQKLAGAGMNQEFLVKTSVQDGKMRMEMGEMTTMLVDGATGRMTALMPGQKMAMVMDKATMAKMQAMAPKPASNEDPKVEATGVKAKVAGFDAEEYKISGAGMSGSVFVSKEVPGAKEMAELVKVTSAMSPDQPASKLTQILAEKTGGALVVKMNMKMVQNGVDVTMENELVKAEEKAVDASLFVVPDGYKVQDMSAVLGGGAAPAAGQ